MRKSNEAAGMPVPASVEAGMLLSWRTIAKTDKSLSRSKNVGSNCCRSEKNSYLCDALHLIQATDVRQPLPDWLFYGPAPAMRYSTDPRVER